MVRKRPNYNLLSYVIILKNLNLSKNVVFHILKLNMLLRKDEKLKDQIDDSYENKTTEKDYLLAYFFISESQFLST